MLEKNIIFYFSRKPSSSSHCHVLHFTETCIDIKDSCNNPESFVNNHKRLLRNGSRKQTFFTTTQKCVGFQENKCYLNYRSSPNFTWATVKCLSSFLRKIKLTLEIFKDTILSIGWATWHIINFNNVNELYLSRQTPEITIVNVLLITCWNGKEIVTPEVCINMQMLKMEGHFPGLSCNSKLCTSFYLMGEICTFPKVFLSLWH